MGRLKGVTTTGDVIRQVSKITRISYAQCNFVYAVFADVVKDEILKGNQVKLRGLGKFMFVHHKVRTSNLTKQLIPEHKHVRFKILEKICLPVRVSTRDYDTIDGKE